ncbi:outer membrane protein assembly factor BamA [Actibacterium pelagium]|uniref:outer membrane protein assembly factor BamA n=1 Tax=Actibacterium pelagium TaxID=2029103 RepID=UPI001E57466C|nr:outer membrane protein assembly factor BamA [Actibacterium pelagium]
MTGRNCLKRALHSIVKTAGKPALVLGLAVILLGALAPKEVSAQTYRFGTILIEGNQRVDDATVLSYAGLVPGKTATAAQVNEASRRLTESGLFESVVVNPRGSVLEITLVEYPTISVVAFEGNDRLDDELLASVVSSQSRRVYNPRTAEADAAQIVLAYEQDGRLAASVTPKIIRRSDNRVDLVFEIEEGRNVEIQRISFVGNRNFSERRLRRVLSSKQAGIFRRFVRSDTFLSDRIEFDKQVLADFYASRGYIDFQVNSVTSELARSRDGYQLTFNVREGQSFEFGEITVSSDLSEVDPEVYEDVIRIRPGQTYTPLRVENTITRLERLSLQQGLKFIRVEPRITRNDRDLTLDIDFVVSRGPRVFVERIDIEGNATTMDRVIRRQFKTVEGDPFNPREIRAAAERIRSLGFFSNADVNAREGSAPDQVIVDVDVEEQPTGSLTLGATYSADSGIGAAISFSERNFLGRGQTLSFTISTASENQEYGFRFVEPAFLSRDVAFSIDASYQETTDAFNASYDTTKIKFVPSLGFAVGENSRLSLRTGFESTELLNYTGSSAILTDEVALGKQNRFYAGYSYTFDNRRSGLDPNAGVLLSLSQDFGVGGDVEFIESSFRARAQKRIFKEEVGISADFEAGLLNVLNGDSRVVDRFFLNSKIRGFEANGIGPRDPAISSGEALGGNIYAVARFETEFPLGLPEEYGITGGLFADFGAVWGLDNDNGGLVDDGFHLRSVIGFALVWDSVLGPLRFNFTHALQKEDYDRDRSFDFTISTSF